jgi:hypothetical protein
MPTVWMLYLRPNTYPLRLDGTMGLAYPLESVEWPPTSEGSRCPVQFARLELDGQSRPLRTGALIASSHRAAPTLGGAFADKRRAVAGDEGGRVWMR